MGEKRCSTCHEALPLTSFSRRRSAPDGRQARCRVCSRAWYAANKAEHVRRVRARNARVRAENQEHLAAYLLEHCCVDCGEADVQVLDFDHEEPSLKVAGVGRLATCSLPWPRILAEIDKCSVRCANCHRRRTSGMHDWWRAGVETGRRARQLDRATSRLQAMLPHPSP